MKKIYEVANHTIEFENEVELNDIAYDDISYELCIKLCTSGSVEIDGVHYQWNIQDSTVKEIFTIEQHDIHFSTKLCSFGSFLSFDEAKVALLDGLEKLYPGFKEDLCENGYNQWTTGKFEFGVMITTLEIGIFQEQ